ncbi:MAG: EamA family transporter [Ruminococcus sp.]|nr:EamA family transporter [Candidatus Copronaster equi]
MSWFVFSLICLTGWGFADLFYKSGADETDRYSHIKQAVWVGLVMGICALCFLPLSETVKNGTVTDFFKNIVKYAPASSGYIISMVIGYAGLRYIELSIVSPVQNASGALSAIAMSLFFVLTSENPLSEISDNTGFTFGATERIDLINNALIILGIVLIVAGVISLAIIEQKLSLAEKNIPAEQKKYKFGALALLFPILYCVFDTIGTAADGIILNENSGLELGEIDVIILYGFTFMLAGIVSWIFLLIKNKKAYNPFEKRELKKGAAAVCEEFGQVFYVYAMAAKPVLAAPMVASYCIFSVILSRIFIKEKLKSSQYACVFSVISGIVMLGISEGFGEA